MFVNKSRAECPPWRDWLKSKSEQDDFQERVHDLLAPNLSILYCQEMLIRKFYGILWYTALSYNVATGIEYVLQEVYLNL